MTAEHDNKKTRARSTRLGDVGKRLDEEIEELIRWMNDDMVPQVRSHSTRALRKAAEKLTEFADYMEQQKRRP